MSKKQNVRISADPKIIPIVGKYESATIDMLQHPKMEKVPNEFREVIRQMAKSMDIAEPMIESLTKQNKRYRKGMEKMVEFVQDDNNWAIAGIRKEEDEKRS